MASEGRRKLQENLLYFVLVPAICLAVLLLGALSLRTAVQIDKARQQAVVDATWSLANERVQRLDRMIIEQDNAVDAAVDVGELDSIADRWLLTAGRETPTVRAVLVVDAESPEHEVRAFVSRRPGPEDDAFRRLLVYRLIPEMDLDTDSKKTLRHLHHSVDGRSYLVSYWQRVEQGRHHLVVAWHYVDKLVHEVMPQIYEEQDSSSRMNVVDSQGQILFGPPIQAGSTTVGENFPTTLYNWRLNVALTSAEGLEQKVIRNSYVQLGVVGLAMLIAVVGVVIVVRASMTERRLAALKSDFVANVSHELKTPLASVRMFGELLLTSRVATPDKQREYLQIIVGESERLSALIDNVLDFAKVERGKDAYELAEADMAEVVGRAVEALRYRAEQEGVELRAELESVTAECDARAVELAVINLVDNALKYGKGTPHVDVSVGAEDGLVRIRVADAGPGIAAADQARIFDRFARGGDTSTTQVRGSGIGLALVKHIAEAHGGTVRVESPLFDDGLGSAFEMRFATTQS